MPNGTNFQQQRKSKTRWLTRLPMRLRSYAGWVMQRFFNPSVAILLAVGVVLLGLSLSNQPGAVIANGNVFRYSVDFTSGTTPDRFISEPISVPAGTQKGSRIHLTVYVKTTDPDAPSISTAEATIYGSRDGTAYHAIKTITSTTTGWSRWDNEENDSRFRVRVEQSPAEERVAANKVDVIVYIAVTPPGSGCPRISLCAIREAFAQI
ncbi:MAG: hypothetical protein M3Z19_11805 [Chloroflexota bacterium]|nr:hypothetical protein [Chloroflexota bacterium]